MPLFSIVSFAPGCPGSVVLKVFEAISFLENEYFSEISITAGWEAVSNEINAIIGQLQQEREEEQLTVASDGAVI